MSDGLLDVVIMEPFDVLEAPQISIDMFNKTLDKSSKIKSFRCKTLRIHRDHPGVIHYDGDPVMTGQDITIRLVEKGINIIVNPNADKRMRKPNLIQNTASDIFNQINNIKAGFEKQSRQIQALNKVLLRKLNF